MRLSPSVYQWFFGAVWMFSSELWLQRASSQNFCRHNDTILKLVNNGYETIGVWIEEKVPQDWELITKFEELISKFSATLYQMTKKRAYVRHVQILIPHAWDVSQTSSRKISTASTNLESESQAQIWIKHSSPRNGTSGRAWKRGDAVADVVQPYVIKTTPCGFPGSYVRISPEFIRFGSNVTVVEEIGLPEKILAREWAKLRWGVYDELPRLTEPSDYYLRSNLEVRPTICSASIPGSNVDAKTSQPGCNVVTSLYDKTCRFEPSKQSQAKTFASLLYRVDLPYVQELCDDAELTSEENAHDEEAPTTHNLHCRGRSIWNVMRDHPDFVDDNNPPARAPLPPPTNFTLVQHESERIVLVLDVSSSMSAYGKLELLRQAVSNFIDTVPDNSYLGIVCFAWRAVTKANLTHIRHDDVRIHLKERLILATMQGTSIGSGILEGIRVLQVSGPLHLRGKGGSIILLTDGREHNRPKINETLSLVRESGVTISTIAIGPKIARDLEIVATQTGGRVHAASSGEFGLDTELQEAFSSHQEHIDGGAIHILSQRVVIPKNSSVSKTFVIDDSIGKNTRITVFYNRTIAPAITLESPTKKVSTIDEPQSNIAFTHDTLFKTIYIRILNAAETGNWTVSLRNSRLRSRMITRINAVSYQRDEEPLVISPALLCRFVDFTGVETVVVYAYLSKGELAVLYALVYAEITRPLTSDGIVDIRGLYLRDDGLDPDVTANDGVYSAYFTSFTAMGRYNVKVAYKSGKQFMRILELYEHQLTDTKVYASDNYGQATLDSNYILGIGNFQTPSVKFDTRYLQTNLRKRRSASRNRRAVVRQRLAPFQRVSSAAGAFVVKNFDVFELCTKGYIFFQDSCYKTINSPASSSRGQAACESEGGVLAVLNSRQELLWLLNRIMNENDLSSSNAWFGGMDDRLRAAGILNIERILPRRRREGDDIDLDALASTISDHTITDDLLSSFEPDLEDMSAREINKLLKRLGLESEKELPNLVKIMKKSQNSTSRWKRQALSLPSSGQPFFLGDSREQSRASGQTDPITTGMSYKPTGATATYDGDQTTAIDKKRLSLAKKEPTAPELISNGERPSCSWFQNRKIVESNGDVCNTPRKFICEKPTRDRFPPSRIVDLMGRFDQEKKRLHLTWSAPGDDLNTGRATRYEIRTLRTLRAIQTLGSHFEKGESLNISETASDDGKPRLAGTVEEIEVDLTKNSVCPPHAVLDIIFALPPDGLGVGRLTTKKKLTLQFIDQIIKRFDINEYEVAIGALALSSNFESVFLLRDHLTPTQIQEKLRTFISTDNTNRTLNEAVETAFQNGGRTGASKVIVVITDENVKMLANLTSDVFNTTKIIVSVSTTVDKILLRNLVSPPSCMNAFVVDNEEFLDDLTANVTRQLCQARRNEFQAVAVKAHDDAGQTGEPSNVLPFTVENAPLVDICPEPELLAPALAVAGGVSTTVAIAVATPITAILAVLGSVMLFGQLKKIRKKRQEKKIKQEQERRIKEMKEAHRRRATAKSIASAGTSSKEASPFKLTDIKNKNNNNSGQKLKQFFGKWRVAPTNNPPV